MGLFCYRKVINNDVAWCISTQSDAILPPQGVLLYSAFIPQQFAIFFSIKKNISVPVGAWLSTGCEWKEESQKTSGESVNESLHLCAGYSSLFICFFSSSTCQREVFFFCFCLIKRETAPHSHPNWQWGSKHHTLYPFIVYI